MNLLRPICLGTTLLGLSSCLQDLEGGPGRVQVHNAFTDTLTTLSVGSWRHEFDPRLAPGANSETFELPVSGHLQVDLRGRHEGRDTVLAIRWIDAPVGEFTRLE